jgi:hypothetical protein
MINYREYDKYDTLPKRESMLDMYRYKKDSFGLKAPRWSFCKCVHCDGTHRPWDEHKCWKRYRKTQYRTKGE